jgi:hypothetical protein
MVAAGVVGRGRVTPLHTFWWGSVTCVGQQNSSKSQKKKKRESSTGMKVGGGSLESAAVPGTVAVMCGGAQLLVARLRVCTTVVLLRLLVTFYFKIFNNKLCVLGVGVFHRSLDP